MPFYGSINLLLFAKPPGGNCHLEYKKIEVLSVELRYLIYICLLLATLVSDRAICYVLSKTLLTAICVCICSAAPHTNVYSTDAFRLLSQRSYPHCLDYAIHPGMVIVSLDFRKYSKRIFCFLNRVRT